MMDKSELAMKMLEWEKKQGEADDLRTIIEAAVLELGETVTAGNVRASYSGGRRSFDYEAPVKNALASAKSMGDVGLETAIVTKIDVNTTTTVSTAWKKVCDDLDLDGVLVSVSDPSVTLRLV